MPDAPHILCQQIGVTAKDFSHLTSPNKGPLVIKICMADYLPQLQKLASFLNEGEMDRAKRYLKTAHQQNFIVCRGLLRWLLSWQTGIGPNALQINTKAKPYLVSHPQLHFNVSHSGSYALIALDSQPIGIDLEKKDPLFTFKELLPSVFSDQEQAWIQTDSQRFYTLWTRKEAIVKALGTGITDNIKQIPVLDGQQASPTHTFLGTTNKIAVFTFKPLPNYTSSLAVSGVSDTISELTLYRLTQKI